MSRGTSLLKCITIILIIFLNISETCYARNSEFHYYVRSACGNIPDIRYPFRLKTDPKYSYLFGSNTGPMQFPEYELACEGNQTVIWLFSKKLHVQAINYVNRTIHVVDPTLQTQDLCSLLPQLTSLQQYMNSSRFHPYDNYTNNGSQSSTKRVAEPIFIFNCPFAVNNSTFVEISGCKLSRYTYLKIGEMSASEVSDGCKVEFIAMTSWPNIKNDSNISLSDLHQAFIYGFELIYHQNLEVTEMIHLSKDDMSVYLFN
ncbi:uncharacterized protein LOC125822544 [Solanum verrucosum]|uniref:uncharacterized protein LOC125822544 n=1 Tax=Solanum verrucosum TaxID=315347 RepID=UPI0020D0C257|nr:uncharacterized protein LOC125822544 [Solanum verrucosum]